MKERGQYFPNAHSLPLVSAAEAKERYTAEVMFCVECRLDFDRHVLEAFS